MSQTESDPSCVFCAIVAGDAQASTVYDDDAVIVFMDVAPLTDGHVLVVPKRHIPFLEDLDEDLGSHIYRVAHRLTRALRRSSLRCEGVNLFLADGAAAFQEVFHTHLHVFPRYPGDGFRIDADWRTRERAELEATATAVRGGLDRLG